MNLGIEQFRGIGTGRYDLDRTVALSRDGGLQRGESVLAQRVKGWANKLACHFGGQERRAGRGIGAGARPVAADARASDRANVDALRHGGRGHQENRP